MTPQQTLENWQEADRTVRNGLSAPGTAPREKTFGMTGMEVFEAIFGQNNFMPALLEKNFRAASNRVAVIDDQYFERRCGITHKTLLLKRH